MGTMPLVVCRMVIEGLPVLLIAVVVLVLLVTRSVQQFQSRVLHVLPFGALSNFSLGDACVGILVSGLFMLYFGA